MHILRCSHVYSGFGEKHVPHFQQHPANYEETNNILTREAEDVEKYRTLRVKDNIGMKLM